MAEEVRGRLCAEESGSCLQYNVLESSQGRERRERERKKSICELDVLFVFIQSLETAFNYLFIVCIVTL